MKILFYISTIRGGGAARVMVNIANGVAEAGNEVKFVTNFPSDHEYVLDKKIRRISLEETDNKAGIVSKNISRIRELRKIIRDESPEVSISFMGENNFRLLLAARGTKTKKIVSVRNDPQKEYPTLFSKVLAKLLYKKADGIVFQTEDAKRFFPEEVQQKSRIIFNQVDEKFFQENTDEGEYIIACGRLSKQKNYPMMIKAFANVLKKYPNENLRIYGEGILKEKLVQLTRDLNIEDSVKFMGFSSDMLTAYRNAKFLVMTSDYEGMPNAMLEALASSIPVISTDCPCGGPKMIIKNGENGYLIPVGDEEALRDRMIDMLSANRANLGKGAFQSAKLFLPSRVMEYWTEAIQSVLDTTT